MLKKIAFTFLMVISLTGLNQAQNINNISFKQSGKFVEISYELSMLREFEKANVSIYVSANGGESFVGPLKEVTGDVGENISNGEKKVFWEVFNEIPDFDGNVVFKINVEITKNKEPAKFLLAYNISNSSFMGLTFGFKFNRSGCYTRFKTNGHFVNSPYFVNENNLIVNYDGIGYYTFSGEVEKSRIGISVGYLYTCFKNVDVNIGLGYGKREIYWMIDEYQFDNTDYYSNVAAKYLNDSYSGVEIELGITYYLNQYLFTIGVNSIKLNYCEFNAGVGLLF